MLLYLLHIAIGHIMHLYWILDRSTYVSAYACAWKRVSELPLSAISLSLASFIKRRPNHIETHYAE
jgi:hypothetical protein